MQEYSTNTKAPSERDNREIICCPAQTRDCKQSQNVKSVEEGYFDSCNQTWWCHSVEDQLGLYEKDQQCIVRWALSAVDTELYTNLL